MKFFIILTIKMYWLFIPKNKRRKCIFKKSCSQFVYEQTLNNGFKSGVKAFVYRYKNCRAGYELFKNPISGQKEMIILNGEIIPNHEIAERLLKK